MENAIFLCGRTALGVWQLLRCLWKPRLDQLQPLPRSLKQLKAGVSSYRAHDLPAGFGPDAPMHAETAAQRRERVRGCLADLCGQLQSSSRRCGPLMPVPLAGPSDIDVQATVGSVVERAPLELMVASPELRRRSSAERFHVHSGPLPPSMFVSLGSGVHVMSPIFTVLQLASTLDEAELSMLAFELRGAYATRRFSPVVSDRCLPLFDAGDVKRVLESLPPGFSGTAFADRPLSKTLDKAASVMEAASVKLLCTARRRGGYGFAAPSMNWRVDVPPSLRRLSRWQWVSIDAYWPEQGVAFEYNGAIAHQGTDRAERDVLRDNVLSALEIPQVAITAGQFFDTGQFDQAARQLARLLRVRMNARDYGPAWVRARGGLRSRLIEILRDETPCPLWEQA